MANIDEAKRKLDELITEIEDEGSSLSEHGCGLILEELRNIRHMLD